MDLVIKHPHREPHPVDVHALDLDGVDAVSYYGGVIKEAELLNIPHIPMLAHHIQSRIDAGGSLDMGVFHGDAWATQKAIELEYDAPPKAVDHACGTTHCLAGWAIHAAGRRGYELERYFAPSQAGGLVFAMAYPGEVLPDFFTDDATGEDWLKARAARDRQQAKGRDL